jgi:hypothetical protein
MKRVLKRFASFLDLVPFFMGPGHSPAHRSFRPRLEHLEVRDLLATVYQVGPGKTYADLWQVPWGKLPPQSKVEVYWQDKAYHSKIDISMSNIAIVGIPGPNNQRPVIDANGAQEDPDASYFTDQIANEGLFTVAPAWSGVVSNVLIQGLELENANQDSSYYDAGGNLQWYQDSGAAVAMYMAENVRIEDCSIHDNGNGIFGKSYGYAGGDLMNIAVTGNDIYRNGVVNSFLEHNSYIEGWYTRYIGNHYGPLKQGAQGDNLKDRSLAPTIAYNYFTGGAHLLDLVDPDDGSGDMVDQPDYGTEWVYGNVLVNPEGSNCSSMVHFGFDEVFEDSQHTLFFYNNTIVNYNDQQTERYYTYLLKLDGSPTAYVFDNVLDSVDPKGGFSGNFYVSTQEYGSATVYLGVNVTPPWTQPGDDNMVGWVNLILADPSLVDALHGDFRLSGGSPGVGAAMGLYNGQGFVSLQDAGLPSVSWQYDFVHNRWVPRDAVTNLGVWESDSSA